MGGGKYLTIVVSLFRDSFPTDAYKTNDEKEVVSRDTKLSGLDTKEYVITYKTDLPGIEKGDVFIDWVIEYKNKKLSIGLLDLQHKETFYQILSTFKFTD